MPGVFPSRWAPVGEWVIEQEGDAALNVLDRIPDRVLAFLTAGFFALLGFDIVVIDALLLGDGAVLATLATGLASSLLSSRRARKLANEQLATVSEVPATGASIT